MMEGSVMSEEAVLWRADQFPVKSDWEDVTRRELRALLADLKRELTSMA